jgi:1-acyl-sn-glycerol-3-phosphate acyltransferase
MDPMELSQFNPRERPTPHAFRPPIDNRTISGVGKSIAKRMIRKKLKVVATEIEGDGLEKLRAMKGTRCLLLPSHSGGFEPYIIMRLSKKLDEDFYYLAAQETFERNKLIGWFMQRLGAYSIVRGAADRQSFMTTKRLLVEGQRRLVIFPEGQTVWQNDTVIPFQEGVIQLAFKAYEEVAKKDPEAPLLCVPIAIKYAYLQPMDREIEDSLKRLEGALFAQDFKPRETPFDRLRDIGEAVLTANEKKHGVKSLEEDHLNDRIQRMKERIVREVEQLLSLTPRPDQVLLDRIRACFNTVDAITHEEPSATVYEQSLLAERQQAARDMYDNLWRVLQFVAIYEGYVRELSTVERFMDVLCLLEMEVFRERRMWGPRKAVVKIGDPVNLSDSFAAYRTGKRAVIQNVSRELEDSVRGMLEDLAKRYSNPFVGE